MSRASYNVDRPRRSAPTAQPPPPASTGGLTPGVVILAIVLTLVAFGCGFGALTVQADIARPLSAPGAPTQAFVVHNGDSPSTVATNLEAQKLIRNALVFKLYLKVKAPSFKPEPGTYQISPSMNLAEIIATLSAPQSQAEVTIQTLEGLRLTQYPDAILASLQDHALNPTPATLPNFTKQDFIDYAINGKPFDDQAKFWYVKAWPKPAYAALEGYLFPATYRVFQTSTALDVIEKMLAGLGEQLCPGPPDHPDAYIYDQAQCKQHQATITVPTGTPGAGQPMGVFDALTARGLTLQQALILASISQREARQPATFFRVAAVYYNRFLTLNGKKHWDGGTGMLEADPTVQYFLDSTSRASQKPWGPLPGGDLSQLGNNPFNTYADKGLPPSAISAPSQVALYAGIYPPNNTDFYFYIAADDCQNHYFSTYAAMETNLASHPAAQATDCSS